MNNQPRPPIIARWLIKTADGINLWLIICAFLYIFFITALVSFFVALARLGREWMIVMPFIVWGIPFFLVAFYWEHPSISSEDRTRIKDRVGFWAAIAVFLSISMSQNTFHKLVENRPWYVMLLITIGFTFAYIFISIYLPIRLGNVLRSRLNRRASHQTEADS